MKTLLIAEHDNHILKAATYSALTASQELSNEVDLLIIGANCQALAEQVKTLATIKKILLADDEVYTHQLAENAAALIAEVGKNYDYIIAGASTFSKNLLPRAAALLNMSMISDVIKIVSADTFVRPIYAGNILATVKTVEKIKILTIRPTAFSSQINQSGHATIEAITLKIPNTQAQFVKLTRTESKRPDLTTARVIISGGRGLKSAENFQLIEAIADQLGAAVGASRAAVDAGFAPNDYQVGQTGKVVAPELYIAVGISGAIQHLAGMKDSKIIVAINNDPEAPIFQIANYWLVGDLFKILPELQAALKK